MLGIRLVDPPAGYELQKVAIAALITKLAGKIFGDVVPPFKLFIRPGALRGSLMPPVEVRFDTPHDADTFRKGATQRVIFSIPY